MNFRKRSASSRPEINVISLVDIMLVLLIFFAATTSFIMVGGIDVNLPSAQSGGELNKKLLAVKVTKDNKLYVDNVLADEKTIYTMLEDAYKQTPAATLVIEADKSSLHGMVVTVIDAGKQAGFENFSIAIEEPGK